MREGSWPIKATGVRTSSMALVKSTNANPIPLLAHLTTPTSTTLRITGNTMRECLKIKDIISNSLI